MGLDCPGDLRWTERLAEVSLRAQIKLAITELAQEHTRLGQEEMHDDRPRDPDCRTA